MRRAAPALLLFLALLLALPAAASAAPAQGQGVQPRAELGDLEDEVMCPICGTLLELADSPQARREKVFVAKLVAEGRSKEEVKDALVAQYGPAVLALPEGSGFDLSAYLVPAIAIAAAIVALAFSLARWRREGERAGAEPVPPPREEDAQRLDADLRRYDL